MGLVTADKECAVGGTFRTHREFLRTSSLFQSGVQQAFLCFVIVIIITITDRVE